MNKRKELSWVSMSALEKAMSYAEEYSTNPYKPDNTIHIYWLSVLAEEIKRLNKLLNP
jgi:hypothetical protein